MSLRFRSIALSAVSLLALSLLAPACSGGGSDDDDDAATTATFTPLPDPTPIPGSVVEVEPNGTRETATAVAGTAGTLAFHGTCTQTGDLDWYSFSLSSGGFSASVTWDEREYIPEPHLLNDLDVYVSDSSGELAEDSATPEPGTPDSPAEVAASIGTAGSIFLLVECFQADEDLFYQGTLTP